jgi:2-acylglycerol O-acyltransferase 2
MAPQVKDYSGGTALERVAGGCGAAVFSLVYFVGPLWILFCLAAIIVAPLSSITHVAWIPLVVSICTPPIAAPWLLRLWIFQCMPKYFAYREIVEDDDDVLGDLMKERAFIFTAVPHGVISYGGICSAIVRADQPFLTQLPTAAATVILRLPFMKNVLGVFGLVDASKGPLTRRLESKQHVVLYLGGIAELFLSSTSVEKLYLKKRAGFIKLALQTGADVVPLYLFGNTSVLSLVATGPLADLSRKLQVSFTLFWGLCGLPIPRPRPVLYVRGKPLGLPKLPRDQITDELVKEWHGKYVAEVERLYMTYRTMNDDYVTKPLEIH